MLFISEHSFATFFNTCIHQEYSTQLNNRLEFGHADVSTTFLLFKVLLLDHLLCVRMEEWLKPKENGLTFRYFDIFHQC